MNHVSINNVTGTSAYSSYAAAAQTEQPASTPADVLIGYGLDPEKARLECDGLRKFLSGQAPATADFDGILRWLNTELPELHDNAQKAKMAAELMVAIQKSHPQFVPVLEEAFAFYSSDVAFGDFQKEFFRHAATDLGLEVCAIWNWDTKPFVEELLVHPKCSICTLDFSEMRGASCWSESAFTNNSSVKTWRGCPMGWFGLTFIGLHVRELQLHSTLRETSSADSHLKQLQTILQKGNIDSVGLNACDSQDHLSLVKTVHSANREGGRVQRVQLLGWTDCESASETLEILLKSKSITSVTLPDLQSLLCVDLAAMKNWLKEGSVASLDLGIVPILRNDACAYEKIMAEITPVVKYNGQRVSVYIRATGEAFGSLFCHAFVPGLGIAFERNFSLEQSERIRTVDPHVAKWAAFLTGERAINPCAVVPYVPASYSPGAKVEALIRGEAEDCPLAKLGPWLAQGLKENSIRRDDLDELTTALRDKLGRVIDGAFDDSRAHNQAQVFSDLEEAELITQALFGPDSEATFASLSQDLGRALTGHVPREQRDTFKRFLLRCMRNEIGRAFEDIVVRD